MSDHQRPRYYPSHDREPGECPHSNNSARCISCHRDRLDSEENADAGYYERNREYPRAVLRWCAVGLILFVVVSLVAAAINITWRAGQ